MDDPAQLGVSLAGTPFAVRAYPSCSARLVEPSAGAPRAPDPRTPGAAPGRDQVAAPAAARPRPAPRFAAADTAGVAGKHQTSTRRPVGRSPLRGSVLRTLSRSVVCSADVRAVMPSAVALNHCKILKSLTAGETTGEKATGSQSADITHRKNRRSGVGNCPQ